MRTINKKRAELLVPIFRKARNEEEEEERMMFDVDCQLTVNSLASQLLRGTFSYKEDRQCSGCTHTTSTILPTLSANESLLSDFSNLSEAILSNFGDAVCALCSTELNTVDSEFGQFLFIEVSDTNFH